MTLRWDCARNPLHVCRDRVSQRIELVGKTRSPRRDASFAKVPRWDDPGILIRRSHDFHVLRISA
jgi:hypothetical protein